MSTNAHPIAAALLLAAAGALAQTTEPPNDPTTLGEIKVQSSAERDSVRAKEASIGVLGDLPLIETPFSVNVITRTLLDNQQVRTYADYLKNDPSANVGNVEIGLFSLRGFAVGGDGYLYDGLPGHTALSEANQLEGIERIEVLKGPSVFLNGLGGSSSGTLNFVPKRPTDRPLRRFDIDYATRSSVGATADLGDRFGADRQFGDRLNLGYRDGEQAAERSEWTHRAATLALDWRATRDLLVTASFDYSDNHYPRIPPFFVVASGVPVPDAPDAHDNIALSWDGANFVGKSGYLRADWTLAPQWTLTAQALKSRTERPRIKEARVGFITDTAGNATLFAGEEKSRTEAGSAQLLLRGTLRTGFIGHRLTFGVSGLREETGGSFSDLGAFDTNLYAPVDHPEPAGVGAPPTLAQKTNARSLLLADIVSFGERWSVLAGVRRAELALRNFDRASGAVASRDSLTKNVPTAALLYRPAAGVLLYVNLAEGLEQGGTAPRGTVNEGERLPPLVTEQIELGAKLETGGMTCTAAWFDLERPREFVDETARFVQAGRQRHRGIELVASGRLAPRLTVVAGMAWIDAKVRNTGDSATEGKRAQSVPRVRANAWADYGLPGLAGWFVNAGLYHNGKQFVDEANTQELRGWTRVDIGARYETSIAGRPTVFRVGIENVADRNYWIGQAGILTLAEPRTVKASVTFDL